MSAVKQPTHYPTVQGGDCLSIIQQLGLSFALGNAMKYIWRAGRKDDAIEDLLKAREYIDREIEHIRLKGEICLSEENRLRPANIGPIATAFLNEMGPNDPF